MRMRSLLLIALGLWTPRLASAGEVQVATGAGAHATSWRGDSTFGQSLRLGYRIGDLVAIDVLGRLGYGTVDDRLLTYLALGATLYGRLAKLRPFARLALVHQHEEPLSAVSVDPFGAIFGVGDGIRHRGGFGGGLGFDLPIEKAASTEYVVGADASAAWFPDPRGPSIYLGGSLWIGVNFSL